MEQHYESSADCEFSPAFPLHVARLTLEINSRVDMMLRDSRVVDVDQEDTIALFDRSELQLGKLVGTGGFSEVFEVQGFQLHNNNHIRSRRIGYTTHQEETRRRFAQEESSNKKYVVKHLKASTTRGGMDDFCTMAADLMVEARVLSSLQHDHILTIRGTGGSGYEGGTHDSYFLILDRLCETLEQRIHREKKHTPEQTASYLLSRTKMVHGIASALEYLHEKDLVFRDLKPDNIGFDEHGTVKIFDFGLARELPRSSSGNVNQVYRMSGEIGTVRYMAPEVALCQEYNQKVDTYSWAMIYWTCLTLEKPYGDMSRPTHLSLVCRLGERPRLLETWPESLENLLTRAWAPNVYFRATMTEVCSCLERMERDLSSDESLQIGKSSSMLSQQSFTRESSNSLVSMVAA